MPRFSPESPPLNTDPELGQYLARLEQRLDEALSTIFDLEQAANAPNKLNDGMVRYADGVNWDPGFGEGLYLYANDQWNFMNFGTGFETDPVFVASAAYTIDSSDISGWNTAKGWGNHADQGYLTSESDPVFVASAAYGISSGDITNWDTAYGWGDPSGVYLPLAGGTLTGELRINITDQGDYWLQVGGDVYIDGDITTTGSGGSRNGRSWQTSSDALYVHASNTIAPSIDDGVWQYRAVDGNVTINLPTDIGTNDAANIYLLLNVDSGGPYTLTVNGSYTVVGASAPANVAASTQYLCEITQWGANSTTIRITASA